MKKLSNFISDSNKQVFNKNIAITLENGTVLDAKISLSDLNETFAKTQILEKILNSNIVSVKFISDNIIVEEGTIDESIKSVVSEYYIPYTSLFENGEIRYDFDINASIFENNDAVISTRTEKQFGWHDQPTITVIKFDSINTEAVVKTLEEKMKHTFGTPFVRLTKKDW